MTVSRSVLLLETVRSGEESMIEDGGEWESRTAAHDLDVADAVDVVKYEQL